MFQLTFSPLETYFNPICWWLFPECDKLALDASTLRGRLSHATCLVDLNAKDRATSMNTSSQKMFKLQKHPNCRMSTH